ncbi:MAG: TraB/GumN family protein [Ferruginibacter sp.]
MKLLYFLFIVLFFNDCKSQPVIKFPSNKDENTLLWEISGKKLSKPSYLFGTFHLMCKDDIQTGINLTQALKNADEVYFEMDLDDPSNTLGALLFMKMKNDTTLSDLYTPEQFKKVESFFKDSIKMPVSFIKNLKPLLLQALLYPKMLSCKSASGMEDVLMKLAKENKKEIRGFETMAMQASFFDDIPYSVQAQELLKGIDSLAEQKKSFDSLLYVYKTQQLKKIEVLMNSSEFGSTVNQEILLDKRNENWVKQLKDLLNKKRLFIAVGAGHLVGKKGLLELLRKEGYTVRPVENRLQ